MVETLHESEKKKVMKNGLGFVIVEDGKIRVRPGNRGGRIEEFVLRREGLSIKKRRKQRYLKCDFMDLVDGNSMVKMFSRTRKEVMEDTNPLYQPLRDFLQKALN